MGLSCCAAQREIFQGRDVNELNNGGELDRLSRSLRSSVVNGAARAGAAKAGANTRLVMDSKEKSSMVFQRWIAWTFEPVSW